MNNTFSPLETGNDVLLLNKDTFTVSRFKELLWIAIHSKLNFKINDGRANLFTTSFCTLPIAGEVQILFNNLQWYNSPIDCQLLKVGSQGWQKGKLRIQIDTKILLNHKHESNKVDICIEFCPDEPTEPESPLDDLRQLPEYRQQP
ncbi:MAG: KGK family protein [Symplocastrum torsivum CPER-KK1]|jgi:hypothetical protein|uniref:KGK family protein n=1 Tax=Symplocastrum torsivum CPER-KK1 TaxID=450513 RepID=A0A951PKC2_9CYAN|nr:KGK family protein [Symplocastrum torsivum CPER-KK1]